MTSVIEKVSVPRVRVWQSEAEIASCGEAWRRLQTHPNADIDFFHLINRFRSEVESPCVLEFTNGGETRGIWIGRIEQSRLPLKLGYLRFGSIPVRRLSFVTGGLLGDVSETACKLLLQRALAVLDEKQLDFLGLSFVPAEHPVYTLATNGFQAWYRRDWAAVPGAHYRMSLPATFEELLKRRSKKHRYWLKRLPRVLEEAFPGEVSIRAFTTVADVDEFCRDAETVSKTTYQHQLGEALRADDEYRARCNLLAGNQALRGYILYVNQHPKAYWLATVYQDTLYLNLTGYCPDLRKFELGSVLLMKLFADHCGTNVKTVDFGHGHALYKERFGDECFMEASIRIYASGLRPLVINGLTALNARLAGAMAGLLARLGLLQKVKAFWREKLAGRAKTPS